MVSRILTRRSLLERGAAAAAFFWPTQPTLFSMLAAAAAPPLNQTQQWDGVIRQRDEGELLISGRRRAPMRIKVDSVRAKGVAMSMVVSEVAPGAAIPVHRLVMKMSSSSSTREKGC